MNKSYFIVLIGMCFVTAFAKAQSIPPVELIEDKQPKRWLLYAQNNTDEEQDAFLMVQGKGFRRSADRPIIKKIPPNGKVLMITLIPLKGEEQRYTKVFTWETNLQTISKRKGEDDNDYVNIRPLKDDELTIFTEANCKKCMILINFLNKNHYRYRALDVTKNHKVKDVMFDHLYKAGYKGGIIDLPVIIYQQRKHWSIHDIQQFIEDYDWSGLKE